MAAYRTMEVTLQSAKDLKKVGFLSRMEVYATAMITGDPRSRQRTPPDRESGKNPNWNYRLRFYVPADIDSTNNNALHIVLRAKKLFGDRDVGEVYVSLRELLAGVTGDGPTPVKFLSYQVRKPVSGKPKGVLNFSYKLSERINSTAANGNPASHMNQAGSSTTPYPAPKSKPDKQHGLMDEPVTAYPAAYKPPYGGPQQHQPYPAAYPPPQGYGYGYQQPPPPQGYGYPPQQGYGYGAVPPRKNNQGMGLGAGLLGGALGGMLVGDMIGDAAGYDAGYDAGFDDGGFGF